MKFPEGSLETRAARISYEPDGIIRIFFTGNEPTLTMALLHEIIVAAATLTGDDPNPILVDITNLHTIERDVRLHASDPEITVRVIAVAIITNSIVSRVLGNFFLGINKPPYPLSLFSDEALAEAWLRQFMA